MEMSKIGKIENFMFKLNLKKKTVPVSYRSFVIIDTHLVQVSHLAIPEEHGLEK